MAALNKYDAPAMDALMRFPLVRLAAGKVAVYETPGNNPMDLFDRLYAREMYIQRGRDPINKLVVGAIMSFDSRYQTVAKVKNNGIVGRNAGLYGKLHDSIGAVIVSKLIESGSWNEKVKAVGHVFGTGRPIKGQIDEANRALWKGEYFETAFFWFAGA